MINDQRQKYEDMFDKQLMKEIKLKFGTLKVSIYKHSNNPVSACPTNKFQESFFNLAQNGDRKIQSLVVCFSENKRCKRQVYMMSVQNMGRLLPVTDAKGLGTY